MEPLGFVTWWLEHQQVIGLILQLLGPALLGVVFFLALLAGLYLIVGVVKGVDYLIVGVVKGVDKVRAHPPPVAAIIILASALFAGWVLVVSVPKPQKTQKQVAWVVATHACSAENEGRPCEVRSPSRR
jgi:hypothetical protein